MTKSTGRAVVMARTKDETLLHLTSLKRFRPPRCEASQWTHASGKLPCGRPHPDRRRGRRHRSCQRQSAFNATDSGGEVGTSISGA